MVKQDKRTHDRYRHPVPVHVILRGEPLECAATDVSYGGVFLRTAKPLRLGAVVKMAFPELPPAGERLEILAVPKRAVIPTAPGAEGRQGVGMSFLGLSGRNKRTWDRFIRHVQHEHPETVDRPLDEMLQTNGFFADDFKRHLQRRTTTPERPVIRVALTTPEMVHRLLTRHVGRRGMFLRVSLDLKVDDPCMVEMVHPRRADRYYFPSAVRYVSNDPNCSGIGVEFVELDVDGIREFREWVSDLLVQLEDEPRLITDCPSLIAQAPAPDPL